MTDRPQYPDAEKLLVVLFADLVGDNPANPANTFAHVGTVTPSTLQNDLPYLRVERIGGPDDGWVDSALVAIDAFAATRDAAFSLAESVRQRLLTFPQVVAGVGTLDKAITATGPNLVPWSDDQTISRFTASYRILTRR